MALWGLIIGLIALGVAMLAVPPFLAMVYGRPKIKADYKLDKGDEDKFDFLSCVITNEPVHNRLLKRLKVERQTAEDVYINLSIMNLQSNTIVVTKVNPKIYTPRNPNNLRLVLPRLSTSVAAQFMIVVIRGDGAATTAPYGGAKKTRVLPPGRYMAIIEIHQAFDEQFLFTNSFHVGTKREETNWGNNST